MTSFRTGTAAVIFMFDPRKLSTWHYVKREVPKVPKNIFVLVLVPPLSPHASEIHYNPCFYDRRTSVIRA